MKFATCLSCMDGRIQLPVINWIKENYRVDCVDMITEAGMDGLLTKQRCPKKESLIDKIDISLEKHGSCSVFIVGHSDCGGNPVDDKKHKKQIRSSVKRVKKWKPAVKVAGLWVSDKWEVEELISME